MVDWQSESVLDSIHNSCDVSGVIFPFFDSSLNSKNDFNRNNVRDDDKVNDINRNMVQHLVGSLVVSGMGVVYLLYFLFGTKDSVT